MSDRSARWFGSGVVAAPMIDLADDSGLLGGVLGFDVPMLAAVSWTSWAWLTFFVLVGVAATRIFARHRPRGRTWFFAGCCLPLAAYVAVGGLRLSTVVAVIMLAYAFVAWRSAPAT